MRLLTITTLLLLALAGVAQERIVYSARHAGTGFDLMLLDPATGITTQVTSLPGDETAPTISTDLARIVCVAAAPNPGFYVVNADGTGWRGISQYGERHQSPSFHPTRADAVAVAFAFGATTNLVPCEVDITRREVTLFHLQTSYDETCPRYLPDGLALMVQHTQGGQTIIGRRSFVRALTDDKPMVPYSFTPLTSAADATQEESPAVSRDGQWVAYLLRQGAQTGLALMRADGTGARTVLPLSAEPLHSPVFSPDGSRLLFVGLDSQSRTNLFTVRLDGTARTQLTFETAVDTVCDWRSPVAPGPALVAPTLLTPADTATIAPGSVACTWSSVASATGYVVEITTDADFSAPVVTTSPAGTSTAATLTPGLYRWRARATAGAVLGPWSSVRSFTVATPPPPPSAGVDLYGYVATQSVGRGVSGGLAEAWISRGGAVYTLMIHNTGPAASSYRVTIPAAPPGWRVNLFDAAGRLVTPYAQGMGWGTGAIPAGTTLRCRLELVPDSAQRSGATASSQVTVTATTDATIRDTLDCAATLQ